MADQHVLTVTDFLESWERDVALMGDRYCYAQYHSLFAEVWLVGFYSCGALVAERTVLRHVEDCDRIPFRLIAYCFVVLSHRGHFA